jgi:hypothetical protein
MYVYMRAYMYESANVVVIHLCRHISIQILTCIYTYTHTNFQKMYEWMYEWIRRYTYDIYIHIHTYTNTFLDIPLGKPYTLVRFVAQLARPECMWMYVCIYVCKIIYCACLCVFVCVCVCMYACAHENMLVTFAGFSRATRMHVYVYMCIC